MKTVYWTLQQMKGHIFMYIFQHWLKDPKIYSVNAIVVVSICYLLLKQGLTKDQLKI